MPNILLSNASAQQRSEAGGPGAAGNAKDAAFKPTPPTDGIAGDWDGLRNRLDDRGIEFGIAYRNEIAGNLSGGRSKEVTEAGQFQFSIDLDAEKLVGWRGATIRGSITKRHGPHLGDEAGLDTLMLVQEIYGRGRVWRLQELWLQQSMVNGAVILRAGRMPTLDFATSDCDFTNLSFCGPLPGKIAPEYWFNTPIASWTGWTKLRSDRFYVKAGFSEDNRNNLDEDFFVSRRGAKGVISHLELGWTPVLGSNRPGRFDAGVWYNTSSDDDALLGVDRLPRTGVGSPALQRSGQHGFYVQGQQQITGQATQDPVTGVTTRTRGLNAFAGFASNDRRTATLLNQTTIGLFYNAPFTSRPKDYVAIGLARTGYNPRAAQALLLDDPTSSRRRAEYVGEISYSIAAFRGVTLRPNVQYVHRPGGRRINDDDVVLAVRLDASF